MASVLVTGSSRGIGMATVLAMGRAGHSVYATMRDPGRSPELAQLAEKESLPIKVSVMDVDSDNSVKESIGAIQKENGPIDVLVNNAGIEHIGSVEELHISQFRAVMETNYFGSLRCIKAVLPQMRELKSGCIVNVSSVAGRLSASPLAPYNASKWALEALSEALAQETKMFNIRVAIVEPGIIDTAMARRVGDGTAPSPYPHADRMAKLFNAALQGEPSPSIVGEKILDIVDSGTWQLRHPVGPDAEPFLQWRASMTDEQWADFGAADDDTWYEIIERDFGMNLRPTG